MLLFTGFSVKNKNNQNHDEIVFLFFLKTRSKNPIISGAYHHLDYMDYMKNLFR